MYGYLPRQEKKKSLPSIPTVTFVILYVQYDTPYSTVHNLSLYKVYNTSVLPHHTFPYSSVITETFY